MSNKNPPCPVCGGKSRSKGKTAAGTQRYRCSEGCGSFCVDPKAPGRPLIGDRPLTPAEKMRRYRKKFD